MAIDRKHIVTLQGRDYPLWAGVLHAAHEAGLRALTTTLVQAPAPENGNLAIVEATALFEDGRQFTDLGDCSPASTSPRLAAAAVRLASTRAKGRCLRDALDVGETMYEELPDGQIEEERATTANGSGTRRPEVAAHHVQAPPAARSGSPDETPAGPVACERDQCGVILTSGQIKLSRAKYKQALCPVHQLAAAEEARQTAAS